MPKVVPEVKTVADVSQIFLNQAAIPEAKDLSPIVLRQKESTPQKSCIFKNESAQLHSSIRLDRESSPVLYNKNQFKEIYERSGGKNKFRIFD